MGGAHKMDVHACSWVLLFVAVLCVVPEATGLIAFQGISPVEGTVSGGTVVTLTGTGFEQLHSSNTTVFFGDIPCSLLWNTLSSTEVACLTVPYPFTWEGGYSPQLLVTLTVNGTEYSSGSRYMYRWRLTPEIHFIRPLAATPGSVIAFTGPKLPSDPLDIEAVRFTPGNGLCSTVDPSNNQPYASYVRDDRTWIQCRVEAPPGFYNMSVLVVGVGYAWQHSHAFYLGPAGELIMFEVFPDVHSVSPQVSHLVGNELLTIEGVGFSSNMADLSVDIDGLTCTVVNSTETTIQCITDNVIDGHPAASENGTFRLTSHGHRYRGGRGVAVRHYYDVSGASVEDLLEADSYPDQPDAFALFPSFEPQTDRRFNDYGEVYDAFFTPVTSEEHLLWTTGNARTELYFSEGTNSSLLDRIAQSTRNGNTYEVYNRRFYSDWSRSGALAQLSESVTLSSNETYLLQGVMKENSGVDFMKVGFLLPASRYMWNESRLVNREEQYLQTSRGYNYNRQQLDVSVDMAAVNESGGSLPQFTLVWDSWETGPMFAFNVTYDDVYNALSSLFIATCQFTNTSDEVFEDRVFDFESGLVEGWARWDDDGRHPEAVEYEAFCQRYSLEVYDGRALAFETTSRRFSLLTYPQLCLAYKIPNDTQVNIAVKITGYDWYYIPVADGGNTTSLSPLLPHFNNGSTHPIVNNDEWDFVCCDVEALVRSGLGLDNSTEAEVEGLGFYADDTAIFQNAFHIDQVSFTSVKRNLIERIPPARPGGMSLFDLARITESDEVPDLENTTVRNISIQFEVRPSLCEVDIPLIEARNDSGRGVLRLEVTQTRSQSDPVEGAVAVKLGNVTTRFFSHNDDIRRIKMIINEDLKNVTGELNVWSGRRSNDHAHQFCSGRNIFIRYDELTGRQPVFEAVSNLQRGQVRVVSRWPGGFFQRPIPGHMLRTVESLPQLCVSVNNVTASCSGNEPFFTPQPAPFTACAFVYRLATPPENITGLRDCPLPWRLHWQVATDKVWNITQYEVVYWTANDTSSAVTVNVTVSDGDGDRFELDLSHLELEKEYLFKIKSHSIEGPGDFSGVFPVYTHRCLPAPPSNLALSRSYCPEQVWQLTWDTPSHSDWNLTKFEVQVEDNSSLPSSALTIEVAIVSPSRVSYSVSLTALDVRRRYNVQVRTFGEEGPGEYSEEIVAYAPEKCLPSPPNSITISRECPFPWKLSWSRSEPAAWNLTSFEVIQRSSHSTEADRWSVEVVDQEQLTFEVPLFSLNTSEDYWFELRSVGLDGAGNYSEAVHLRAQMCVPPPPLLGVSRVCPGPWRLRWLHDLNPSWNVTHYDVIWEEGGEEVGMAEVAVLSPPQEVYEVALSGLNVTSEYAIRVRGVNRDGPGNYSDDLLYQPHLCVPHPPTIVDVVQTDLRTVILSWAMPDVTASNVTHFEVTLSAEGGAVEESAVVPASAAQTVYNATFEGLSELQRYFYQVRGFSEDGPGNYSNAKALTLVEGCGVGRYRPPRCLTRCEERCGRGNPCHAFSGVCTCNPCWKGAVCGAAVSSLCFEDYIKAIKKEEKLLSDYGNTIPEPPLEYLYRFISEAMQDVPSDTFQVTALSFEVHSREDIFARPLAMVSLVVNYEGERQRAEAGVRRLHQLVHSGLWRATLIQRDHPSTLPTSSTIIMNV